MVGGRIGQGAESARRAARGIAVVALLLLTAGTARAERTDVLVLRNGDQLTGEIKTLKQGMLNFKTDDMSTLEVKWTAVARLVSIHTFEIELTDGGLYWGSFEDSGFDGKLALKGMERRHLFEWNNVVRIGSVKDSFWGRVDGSASLGFSYTKASGVGQASWSLDAVYRARKSQWALGSSSIVTSQSDLPTTRRADLTLDYSEDVGGRWFWTGGGALQQNDELGLALRTLVKGAFGRRLVQARTSELSVSAGLSVNRETPLEGESQDSAEGVATLNWRVFRHNTPKHYVTVSLNVFPSITESGRVRTNSDIRYRHELITDLFFELKLYVSSDNMPIDQLAGNVDYGVVTSLAYTF
jgi:hypothetical protein